MSIRKAFSISLHFNKTLLHKSSQWSSLVTGPRLNSSPPEAKKPGVFCGSATTFDFGGSSRILQDKVRMLGALVLCSPSEHVFCCALLTLWCAFVNEWHALRKTSKDPCSAVPQWPHTAYGRNPVRGLYQPANAKRHPMSPSRSGQKRAKRLISPFSVKLSGLFDHFISYWELELLS